MRRNAITYVFPCLLALLLIVPAGSAAEETRSYKIGVNLELTGPWANATRAVKLAMQMEADRINRDGGIHGRPLELLIRDNGFDQAKVSMNMLNFVRDGEILAVVGPFEDHFQASTRAIAEREGITNIIVCPSNPRLRALEQKWSFNIAPSEIVLSRKLTTLCRALGYETVVVFAGNWPLARGIAETFERFGREQGVRVVVSEETHNPTDIDMKPQLIKIGALMKAEGADALFLSTGGPPGPIICKNLETLGIDVPVLGTHAFGFGFILGLGGKAMEGVTFPTGKTVVPHQLDEDDPVRPVITAFDRRMKERYGVGADQTSGHGYDIVHLIAGALRRCGEEPTRAAFRDALEQTEGFLGCTGVYRYGPDDHEGLDADDMVFVRIEGGRFERIQPEER